MDVEKDILTVSDVAKRCGVTRATIWRWIKLGQLKAGTTAGGHHRIHIADLSQFMKTKKMGAGLRGSIDQYRILVVDDDPNIRKLFDRLLSAGGYGVDFASDGFEAGIKIMKFKPHLVILDLIMPKMDGFEVCRRIKQDAETRDIKIIAISGYGSEENMQRILDCGADLFVPKPVVIKKIKQDIETMLNNIRV